MDAPLAPFNANANGLFLEGFNFNLMLMEFSLDLLEIALKKT